MGKTDEILAEIKKLNVKLYGENGFEGDIPVIKRRQAQFFSHFDDHSKRITIMETRMEKHEKPSKKAMAGWISGVIAVGVALWKAWTGN